MTRLYVDGVAVEAETRLLPWQRAGLSYTASGYGQRIPTSYVVRVDGRWRRVYCCCYSNLGTCYIEGPRDPATGRKAWRIVDDGPGSIYLAHERAPTAPEAAITVGPMGRYR